MARKRKFRMATGVGVPRTEAGIDRMLDLMDERLDPIDELPDHEPIDRLVRSMTLDATSRFQAGSLL